MPTNVLIAFYSRNGTIENLALAAAEGARAAGAEVRMRRARDLPPTKPWRAHRAGPTTRSA